MVLDKLGDSLKAVLSKVASSIFVDEKLVNELIKELQKALLKSDVNVKLVFELTNKIKERVLKGDVPKGLTKKEFLINVLYEELTNFLGREGSDIKIGEKKSFKIMLVGLFGNGKCVHKDSNVLLNTGRTITIEKLYSQYKNKDETILEDGYIIPLRDELYVPSFNPSSLKIEKKRVTHLWKLKSKDLIKINLDNGNNFDVKTTQEHPFFVLDRCDVKKVRADTLKKGDYVATPRKYFAETNNCSILNQLTELDLDVYVSDTEASNIKKEIKSKFGTLQKAIKEMPFKRNYASFIHSFKKGQLPIYFYKPLNQEKLKLKNKASLKTVTFPLQITSELSEFIGYVIGDGYVSKKNVHISTADIEIIERLKELSVNLFNISPSLTFDKRTKSLIHVRLNSYTIAEIFHKLFKIPTGKKTRKLEVPQLIQESELDTVSKFLRAYFDCDGHFSKKGRQIEIVSESRILLKQIHHLLLRFNILGVQSIKIIKGQEYYRLFIQGRSAEEFLNKIGSLIKRKYTALSGYKGFGLKQGDGKHDMIPIPGLLKDLRRSSGYSIGQLQSFVSSYGLYETKQLISRSQLKKVIEFYDSKVSGNVLNMLSAVQNQEKSNLCNHFGISQPLVNALVGEFKKTGLITEVTNSPTKIVLTNKGHKYLKNYNGLNPQYLLEKLREFAYSDISWIRVKNVEKIKNSSGYVYDMTVEGNHSFIADGMIVHNTTVAGKLAKFYQKRGYKVALISTDTWRPAAFKQLQMLGEQIKVPVFGDPTMKDPVAIFKKFELELSRFNLVIIDTAGRDALNDELVEELVAINNAVNADEKLLIMSADVGQAAQKQAETFHSTCNVTGVVITKLDGTAKGGGALSACAITSAPVKFIGVGEKIDELEVFDPKRFVGRLLGMGDLETLLEKAKEAMSEEDAQDLSKKLLKGDFNLIDLYQQMEAMSKMGSLGKIMEMIPGMGQLKLPKDALKVQGEKLVKWKFILDSCTKFELENPDKITPSRIERIAKGSGMSVSDIRDLLKQYKQSKKMMKAFGPKANDKNMKKLMQKMQGKIPGM